MIVRPRVFLLVMMFFVVLETVMNASGDPDLAKNGVFLTYGNSFILVWMMACIPGIVSSALYWSGKFGWFVIWVILFLANTYKTLVSLTNSGWPKSEGILFSLGYLTETQDWALRMLLMAIGIQLLTLYAPMMFQSVLDDMLEDIRRTRQ